MNAQELERRRERAKSEPWIIAKTETGFRIHSPTSGGRPYLVSGIPDHPTCTCPDFEKHARDPEWRCKHILAVLDRNGGQDEFSTYEAAERTGMEKEQEAPAAEPGPRPTNGHAQMLLKRSVSPDGRIDSLSVEFSCPVEETLDGSVETHAQKLLELQNGIVHGFLNGNRTPKPDPYSRPISEPPQDGAEPAQLLRIGGTDGKWGRRLFLTVQANSRTLRLYGSQASLAEHLTRAGYPDHAGNVREGVSLNLPCRIVTQPAENGFLNIQEVLPPLNRHSVPH